jgi:demethylmenaquinone methyltransferase/2-methoxy-6-polyprenyl-1,4-benzoquinol methylase
MSTENDEHTTHFGYRDVPLNEKANLVADVFRSVAPKYDLMNDAMSFGLHRLWKRFAIAKAELRPGQVVLDVASGTGDLAIAISKIVGKQGKVVMTDINEAMLQVGRERVEDAGIIGNIDFALANAEQLPFESNYFDRITIAFGLRNVTDKSAAIKSMYRVLKPGGKLLILEFSRPVTPLLNKIYDLYSFNVIPKMGEMLAKDRDSYQYLVESIRMHPDQEKLKTMMTEAGFEDAEYFNLSGGIVALHVGYKY